MIVYTVIRIILSLWYVTFEITLTNIINDFLIDKSRTLFSIISLFELFFPPFHIKERKRKEPVGIPSHFFPGPSFLLKKIFGHPAYCDIAPKLPFVILAK